MLSDNGRACGYDISPLSSSKKGATKGDPISSTGQCCNTRGINRGGGVNRAGDQRLSREFCEFQHPLKIYAGKVAKFNRINRLGSGENCDKWAIESEMSLDRTSRGASFPSLF